MQPELRHCTTLDRPSRQTWHRLRHLSRPWLAAFIALLLAGCTGLGGEPAIVATIPPPTAAPMVAAAPPTQPDVAAGAAIFAARCASCHAGNGNGQSTLYTNGEIPFPGNFTDPAQTTGKTPADYFDIITNGNLAMVMPPWRDALSEADRWHVAMYTYTLAYTPEQVAQGRALVGQQQALMQTLGAVLGDPEAAFNLSDEAIAGQVAAVLPALSEADRMAVVAYTRSQTVSNLGGTVAAVAAQTSPEATPETTAEAAAEPGAEAAAAGPIATEEATAETTPEATAEPGAGLTITGTITNGTEGFSVPPDLVPTLRIFDENFEESRLEAPLEAGNTFRFSNVQVPANGVIFVSVQYNDRAFSSRLTGTNNLTGTHQADITLYEVTDDPSVIEIIGQVQQVFVTGGSLEIVHVWQFANTSDRVFSGAEGDEFGRFPSLVVSLPVGAVITAYDNQSRYIVPEDEPNTLIDTRPVFPGDENFIQLSYLVPYDGAAVIDFPVNYPQTGPMRLLLASDAMSVNGGGFVALGPQQLNDGSVFMAYGSDTDYATGQSVNFELRGGAAAITSGDSGIITSDNLAPVLVGLGVVLLVMGGGLYLLQRNRGTVTSVNSDALIDGLVRQIAELDADHEAGRINHDQYHNRRAQLKQRLSDLMDAKINAGDAPDTDDASDTDDGDDSAPDDNRP